MFLGEFLCCFTGSFERYQYFNFETDFQENKNLFQKTGERTGELRLRAHRFHTKTTISKANVKTNRMVSTK